MTEKLSQKRVDALVRAGVPGETRDAAARGLVLRVRSPDSHSWSIRRHLHGKNNRLELGNGWSLEEARDLAREVDRRVRANADPWWRDPGGWVRHWTAARLAKHDIDPSALDPEPEEPAVGRRMPDGPALLWVDALASWVEHVASIRRPASAESYRKSMRIAEMRAFDDRWVSEVKVEEVAEAVFAIHKRGAERQARATAIAVRLFFKWMGSAAERSRTGVKPFAMKDVESPEYTNKAMKKKATNRGAARIPNAAEIGVVARGLRSNDSAVMLRDRLACMLTLYSCQRRQTVAGAMVAQFESAGDLGGLWKMPPSHRKTAEMKQRRGLEVGDHVVPLPPAAWDIVKQAIALAGPKATYLFPSLRQRRAGKESLHMPPEAITHGFASVAGNLCSPHDMRRGFGTTFRNATLTTLGMSLEQTKTILDHNEGVASGDVTATHYSFLSGTHEKWPLMNGWVTFVDKCEATRD